MTTEERREARRRALAKLATTRTCGFYGTDGPTQRCQSCDHPRDFHDHDGCQFTLRHVRRGEMADCPCAVTDPPKEDTPDAPQ